jgi:hypothetical protein
MPRENGTARRSAAKEKNWRLIAYPIWILIVLGYVGFFLTDLRLDFAQLQSPCTGDSCNYLAISQTEINVLEDWGLNSLAYSTIMNGATVLGVAASVLLSVVILLRQGTSRIGWSISLALVVIPITMISDADNVTNNFPNLFIPVQILSSIGSTVLLGFIYLFPSGRFYPRWGYGPFILSVLIYEFFSIIYDQIIEAPSWLEGFIPLIILGTLSFAFVFQIFRYRRDSNTMERQQTKWLLFGIFLLILGFPVWFTLFGGVIEFQPGQPRLLASLGGWLTNMLFILSLPITMVIAIMRYRLWDIDLVIRRTLQYAMLTGLLALTYFGGVVVFQWIIGLFSSEAGSPVVTVLSTLIIAALFNPLRVRIQRFIDRRFFRKKYDAERTLSNFATTIRDEVEMTQLTSALLGVVDETIQPEGLSLWVKREES